MFLFCFGVRGTHSQGCVCARRSLCLPGLPLVIKWIKSKLCFTEKSLIIYYLLLNFEHPFWRVPKIWLIDVCDLCLSFFIPSAPFSFSFSVQPQPEVCLIPAVSWIKPLNGYSWFTSSLIRTDKHYFPCGFFSRSHTVVGTWDMWMRQKFSRLI